MVTNAVVHLPRCLQPALATYRLRHCKSIARHGTFKGLLYQCPLGLIWYPSISPIAALGLILGINERSLCRPRLREYSFIGKSQRITASAMFAIARLAVAPLAWRLSLRFLSAFFLIWHWLWICPFFRQYQHSFSSSSSWSLSWSWSRWNFFWFR